MKARVDAKKNWHEISGSDSITENIRMICKYISMINNNKGYAITSMINIIDVIA